MCVIWKSGLLVVCLSKQEYRYRYQYKHLTIMFTQSDHFNRKTILFKIE